MSEKPQHGSCLCGTVSFEADGPFKFMLHCHCTRCRKSSGTGHATNLTLVPEQFRWLSGEEAITRYNLPTAIGFGKWFCSLCGSPVPRLMRDGQFVIIPAGTLDTEPPMAPTGHIFWGSRAAWSCESGELPTHAEYPWSGGPLST